MSSILHFHGRRTPGRWSDFLIKRHRNGHDVIKGAPRAGTSLFTVLFDLGTRSGNEVIKAIVMGTQGVLSVNGVSLLLVGE
jgi:hypothetical protein